MDIEHFLPGIIGAFVGVLGWLAVGLYIQRRQFARQARNAARAVYFELDANLATVGVARDYGAVVPLSRSVFDKLFAETATWLNPVEVQAIVAAYMSHAGYEQVRIQPDHSTAAQRQVLEGVQRAHREAVDILRKRIFSPAELRALKPIGIGAADVKDEALQEP